jgi:hypothetical protein
MSGVRTDSRTPLGCGQVRPGHWESSREIKPQANGRGFRLGVMRVGKQSGCARDDRSQFVVRIGCSSREETRMSEGRGGKVD